MSDYAHGLKLPEKTKTLLIERKETASLDEFHLLPSSPMGPHSKSVSFCFLQETLLCA